MMEIEKWDILSEDGLRTGKTTLRGFNVLKPGEYHLVVHIWILSEDGRFLMQRRSDDRKLMPGEWAATGGAAISGENSFAAAGRELFEELGIQSTEQTLKKLARIKKRNSLLDIWMITVNAKEQAIKLQADEVAEVKWVSSAELLSMIDAGEFHNYGKEYYSIVFNQIKKLQGVTI